MFKRIIKKMKFKKENTLEKQQTQNKEKEEEIQYKKGKIIKKKLLEPFELSKKHLIVDDSNTNRLVLAKYLQRIGITVDEANDGFDCVEKCEKIENINDYDIIWMDVRMPYKDGYETSKILREMGYKNYIIGLTGHVEQESLNKCISVGMNKVIAKPIMRDELYGLLYYLIGIPEN